MDENNPLRDFFASILGAAMLVRLPQQDDAPKEIGDKVIMLDIHNMKYVCHFDTGEPIDAFDEEQEHTDEAMVLFAQGYIVADNNVKHTYKCKHCPHDHHCDTVVYSPETGKKYYTNASDIKIVE